jgi:hypothetical protein
MSASPTTRTNTLPPPFSVRLQKNNLDHFFSLKSLRRTVDILWSLQSTLPTSWISLTQALESRIVEQDEQTLIAQFGTLSSLVRTTDAKLQSLEEGIIFL